MATFTGINPFFIIYGYNTLLLDYDIAAANAEDRGARTLVKIQEKIIKKFREAFDFAQAVIMYAYDI